MNIETELINEFQRAHAQLIELVNRFPENQRESVLFDSWSLKDILAHIAAWDHIDAEHTECVRDGKEFEWISDWDAFNEREVSKRKQMSWNAVMEEWISSANYVVSVFQTLPASVWDKRCGPENKATPRGWLTAEISHYRNEHIPLVARKLKELKGL